MPLPAPLPPQTRLNQGRYTVQRLQNKGGFGNVYLAHDTAGTAFAIKEVFDDQRVRRAPDGVGVQPLPDLPQAAREHAHQCEQTRREAMRFAQPQLQHANLVRILGCFDQNGTTYLVMPFIDGQSLQRAALRDGQPRDTAWVMAVLVPVAQVLELLHHNGMIHRDLKPDNVLIEHAEGQPRPIVLDTGATRGYNDRLALHTGIVTDFGPPEIVSSSEARYFGAPGPGSDCFALAGVAYLLFSGQRPAGWGVRIAAINQRKPDPLAAPTGLSPAVWAVLQRSLQLPVKRRHAGVADFMRDLHAALGAARPAGTQNADQPVANDKPRPAPRQPHLGADKPQPQPAPAPAPVPLHVHVPAIASRSALAPSDLAAWTGAIAAQVAMCLLLAATFEGPAAVLACLCCLGLHWAVAAWTAGHGVALPLAMFPLANLVFWWQRRLRSAASP